MQSAPDDPVFAPWSNLRRRLAGRFEARARGLVAPELALSGHDGAAFGRLRVRGPEGADFEAGDEGSLPVAVFALYRLVALRSRAFLTGAGSNHGRRDHARRSKLRKDAGTRRHDARPGRR